MTINWDALDLPAWPAGASDGTVAGTVRALLAYSSAWSEWVGQIGHWRVLKTELNTYVDANLGKVILMYMAAYITYGARLFRRRERPACAGADASGQSGYAEDTTRVTTGCRASQSPARRP